MHGLGDKSVSFTDCVSFVTMRARGNWTLRATADELATVRGTARDMSLVELQDAVLADRNSGALGATERGAGN